MSRMLGNIITSDTFSFPLDIENLIKLGIIGMNEPYDNMVVTLLVGLQSVKDYKPEFSSYLTDRIDSKTLWTVTPSNSSESFYQSLNNFKTLLISNLFEGVKYQNIDPFSIQAFKDEIKNLTKQNVKFFKMSMDDMSYFISEHHVYGLDKNLYYLEDKMNSIENYMYSISEAVEFETVQQSTVEQFHDFIDSQWKRMYLLFYLSKFVNFAV